MGFGAEWEAYKWEILQELDFQMVIQRNGSGALTPPCDAGSRDCAAD